MHPAFVTHQLEDGHITGRNMSEVYRVYNTLSRTYVNSLVFATVSNCSGHGYGSQQNRRFNVGKGIHNVEIPPVCMSVCPPFGRKQLNECPWWREFFGSAFRQEKHSGSSAVSSGFANSSFFSWLRRRLHRQLLYSRIYINFFFLANNLSYKNNAYFTRYLDRNYCSHCIPSLLLIVLLYIKLRTRVDTPISHVAACPCIRWCWRPQLTAPSPPK